MCLLKHTAHLFVRLFQGSFLNQSLATSCTVCPSCVFSCIVLHFTVLLYIHLLCSIMGRSLVSFILFFSKMASHNTAPLLPTETTAIQPSHLFPNPGPCSLLCLGCSLEGQQPLHREVGRGEGRNSFHCFS